jgi:hypothetical protein
MKIFLVSLVVLISLACLRCAQPVQKQKTDQTGLNDAYQKQQEQKRGLPSMNAESKPKGAHETWLITCQDQLSYLESHNDPAPKLEWSKTKKEEVLKRSVKYIFELVPKWAFPRKNNDNGTELVNIEINAKSASNNKFILADGEMDTTLDWEKDGAPVKTALRSWTGTKEGIRKKLKDKKDAVCLMSFKLKAWGKVQGKDVVVVLENTNEHAECLQYIDDQWKFMGWSTYGREPVYTMIMWEENNDWKSTIRSKKLFPLEKEEICQVLGEQWGVIPRKGPPKPLLQFGED